MDPGSAARSLSLGRPPAGPEGALSGVTGGGAVLSRERLRQIRSGSDVGCGYAALCPLCEPATHPPPDPDGPACRLKRAPGEARDAFLAVLDGHALANLVARPAPLRRLPDLAAV